MGLGVGDGLIGRTPSIGVGKGLGCSGAAVGVAETTMRRFSEWFFLMTELVVTAVSEILATARAISRSS